jgi:hypothetical protein
MEGSSNQSVDRAASRRSGNITYTSHLCPFSLPTSSLSTILGRDKAIVFLSLMLVLVSHILKRAKLHLRKKKRKPSQSHSLLVMMSLFFPSPIHSPLGFITVLSFSHFPILSSWILFSYHSPSHSAILSLYTSFVM